MASQDRRAEPTSEPESTRLITKAFARVLAAQLAVGFGFSIFFLLPKYLATQLHAGPTAIGNVAASSLAAAVATTPLMGRLLDRYGRRRPMALSALLVAASSLGMLRVTQIDGLLYALRVVQGMGFALGFNAAAAYVADIAPRGRLGQAMGLLGAASLITNAIAPALFESVALRFGWPLVFASAAVTGLVTFLIALGLPETTRPHQRAQHIGSVDPRASRVAFVAAVTGATFGTLITFTTPFALLRGAERVAPYLVGYTLGALLVRLALGKLADRAGRHKVAQLALAGYGSVALLTALLTPGLLLLFGLGFGVAHGFLYPTLAAMAAESTSPERRGRTLANFNAAFNAGAGLALFSGGWVARVAGYPLLFSLVGMLALTSVLSLAAPAATLVAPPESKP